MAAAQCSKCQSEKIIPQLCIADQAGHNIRLGVNVYEDPNAIVFKGKHSEELYARICGDCGNVELFINNPHEFYSVHSDANKTQT